VPVSELIDDVRADDLLAAARLRRSLEMPPRHAGQPASSAMRSAALTVRLGGANDGGAPLNALAGGAALAQGNDFVLPCSDSAGEGCEPSDIGAGGVPPIPPVPVSSAV